MLVGLATAVSLSACTSSDGASTSSSASGNTSTTIAVASGDPPEIRLPLFPDDLEVIDLDPAVRFGRLENGLSYYVRENSRPGGEIQLRLAVKAGSAVEADDQRGAAHYVEHMLFNGTEAFPGNELIRVLERFGAEFGPDVNAFTSYDQTVYELSLPNDPATLETAFDVLFEWATNATLDPVEVEAERGVLLEEWRVRSQGFFGRYSDAVAPVLLAGSPYAGHDPLASPPELERTTPATLRRYYEDWYRPELMGIIAVGDFEADEVVVAIESRFDELTNPADAPGLPELATSPFRDAQVVVLADPEITAAFVELNYPRPQLEFGTIGVFRQSLAEALAWDMLVARLDEDTRRGDTPFLEVSFAANPFVDGQRTDGLFAFTDTERLDASAEALLGEVQRAVDRGFAADELDRSLRRFRADVEARFLADDTKQDWEYAAEYLDHFLTGFPAPAAEETLQLTLRLLEEMTPRQVTDTFRANVLATRPLVIVGAPDSAADDMPTPEEVVEIYERVLATDTVERADDASNVDALMIAPEPGNVVSRTKLEPLGPTVLTLSNGVTVAYLKTDIAANFVSFEAFSPGGWLHVPPEDAVEAQLISEIVAGSGVGGIDSVSLDRFLLGSVVNVFPYISERGEGLIGDVEAGELETLMQLIHLLMTAPQVDEVAVNTTIARLRQAATAPDSDPFQALANEYQTQRYRDSRYLDVPSISELAEFDSDRALEIYRERFFDANDFVFAFAGDFRATELEELAATYLGSLPSLPTVEGYGEGRPPPPEGVVEAEVRAGAGELGAVQLAFTRVGEIDFRRRMEIPLLESILNQRLTAILREELGATYSPFVVIGIDETPPGETTVFVEVVGDPAGLDEIERVIFDTIADLQERGPTADELSIAKEQVTAPYGFVSNVFWIDTMLRYVGEPGGDPGEIDMRRSVTNAVSIAEIGQLAREVLRQGQYIGLRLEPGG